MSALHLRHRLLAEIGDEGVARFCAAKVDLPRADRVAREYLERAGVTVSEPTAVAEPLDHAQRALNGALYAVETLKRIAGVGTPGITSFDLEQP